MNHSLTHGHQHETAFTPRLRNATDKSVNSRSLAGERVEPPRAVVERVVERVQPVHEGIVGRLSRVLVGNLDRVVSELLESESVLERVLRGLEEGVRAILRDESMEGRWGVG